MNKIFKSVLLAALLFPAVASAEPMVKTIDTQNSVVGWVGKKVAGQHNGTVKLKNGEVTVDGDVFISGKFDIDMTSISNNDLEPGEWKDKLEAHLKSDDFFNVSHFPVAKFDLSKAVPASDAEGNTSYTVSGKLTVKGITNEVSFPATIVHTDGVYRAKANFNIDRTKWNIKYNSAKLFDIQKLGDKLIYDEIEISLDIVSAK